MLKKYRSVQDVTMDIRFNKRFARALATGQYNAIIKAAGTQTDDDDDAPVSVIKLRDDNEAPASPITKFNPKITRDYTRQIKQQSTLLKVMLERLASMNGIISSLQNDFRNSEDANIAKLIATSNKVIANLNKQIDETKTKLSSLAEQTAPPDWLKFAKKLDSLIESNLKGRSQTIDMFSAAGIIPNPNDPKDYSNVQHTVYWTVNNLRSDDNQNAKKLLTPQYICALSLLGGKYYIQSVMHRITPPGKFDKGMQVAKPADAWIKIAARLEFDHKVSALPPVTVPFAGDNLNLTKLPHVKRADIKNDHIIVLLDNAIGSLDNIHQTVNEITKILYTALYKINPRSKLRLSSVVETKDKNTTVTFKFVGSGARQLDSSTMEALKKILSDSEINKVRQIIESSLEHA